MGERVRAMMRWHRTHGVSRLGKHAPVLGVVCEAAINEPAWPLRLVLLAFACLLSVLSENAHRDCPDARQHRNAARNSGPAAASAASPDAGPHNITADVLTIEAEK